MSDKNPLVSAIILTKNRPNSLIKCLSSIIKSTYRKIEIIVFDNSKPDLRKMNAYNILLLPNNKIPINQIYGKTTGFANMRSQAISNSNGQLILSIDDDCIIDKYGISNIIKVFNKNKNLGVLGGNILNIGFKGKSKYKGRGKIGINGSYQVSKNINEADVFGSANMTFSKIAYETIGGYDIFFAHGLEEADLCLSIRSNGFIIKFAKNVKIKHYNLENKTVNSNIYSFHIRAERLYLFFKHFMPKNILDWKNFIVNEIRLLLDDLGYMPKKQFGSKSSLVKTRVVQRKSINLKAVIYNKLLDPIAMIVSRSLIPYYIIKASIRRKRYQFLLNNTSD